MVQAPAPPVNGRRINYGRIPEMLPVANLIDTQLRSFAWFKREGLRELFEEINPITDYTTKNYELKFLDYEFGLPKFDKEECRNRDMTYAAPLRINTRLTIKTGEHAGQITASEVFMADVDNTPDHRFIESTLEKDVSTDVNDALIEMYKKIRPGDPPTVENARSLLSALFFNARRFDLSKVGRFKLNRRLGLGTDMNVRTLSNDDFLAIIRKLIELNNGRGEPDDIDHLGNRRVRAVGELLQNQFRMGLIRMERIIKERMTITDAATVTAASLINARPVVAAIKEFFGSSQLSQFMDQTNPLAELTHKRRLSALGPGGLSRARAGFDVRDVHHS